MSTRGRPGVLLKAAPPPPAPPPPHGPPSSPAPPPAPVCTLMQVVPQTCCTDVNIQEGFYFTSCPQEDNSVGLKHVFLSSFPPDQLWLVFDQLWLVLSVLNTRTVTFLLIHRKQLKLLSFEASCLEKINRLVVFGARFHPCVIFTVSLLSVINKLFTSLSSHLNSRSVTFIY